MRLLFLNHNYRFSGTYYRAMPMAEHLAQRGHLVTLLTVSPQRRWRASWSMVNGVRLGEMPNWGQDNSGGGYGPLDNAWRCLHSLTHHFDVVHMFDHKPNATFAGFAARLWGARLVADWADWWGGEAGEGGLNDGVQRRIPAVGRFESWWETRSKRRADGVITISRVLEQRALALGCSPGRVLYLPTGAAVDRIQPLPVVEARRQLGLPIDRHVVGFIGVGQGDMELVVGALRQLPGVGLMVIGPRSTRLLELARASGVADRLRQTGFVPDEQVGLHLACADVMVLPLTDRAANRGRLPNKLLDYLAAGRPTVASPVGDIKTIMEEHAVGLLAGENDFAQAIASLLSSPETRAELGHNARRVAEEVFNWDRLIDRLESFYRCLY